MHAAKKLSRKKEKGSSLDNNPVDLKGLKTTASAQAREASEGNIGTEAAAQPMEQLSTSSRWKGALKSANTTREAIDAFKNAGRDKAKRIIARPTNESITPAAPVMDPPATESHLGLQPPRLTQTASLAVVSEIATSASPISREIYLADIGSSKTLGILDQIFISEMVSLMGSYLTASKLNTAAQMMADKTGVNINTILKIREAMRNSTLQSHGKILVPLELLSQSYLTKKL